MDELKVTISRLESDGKISLQESSGMAIVTIHRPRAKNALTKNMWQELTRIGKRIPNNPKTKVVILRGGQGVFSAGSDIKEFSTMSIDEVNDVFHDMERAISIFERMKLPTIALVNGPALGAGFQLALACDLRYATPSAKMGIPIGRLGITLSKAFVNRMTDIIGVSRMKELVYTGKLLNAEEAQEWGVVNDVLSSEEDAEHVVLAKANLIKQQSPASLRAVKEKAAYSRPIFDIPLQNDYELSIDPKDFQEGVRAFIEKRKPNF